jgi:hypothetical protein
MNRTTVTMVTWHPLLALCRLVTSQAYDHSVVEENYFLRQEHSPHTNKKDQIYLKNLSPRQGASSCHGGRRRPPDMAGSWKYVEYAVADRRKRVVFKLCNFAESLQPLSAKKSYEILHRAYMRIHNIRSCPPYLKALFYIGKLRTRHVIEARDPFNALLRVLYKCETWSRTVREWFKLKIYMKTK